MENTTEDKPLNELPTDLPVTAENIAYGFDELIACGKCGRNNPPNRLKCLYCGAELEFSAAQSGSVKPVLRRLEAWEKGFNLIYIPGAAENIDEQKIKQISRMTRIDTEVLQKFFAAGKPLPLARAESVKEADIVNQRFAEIGVETRILSDDRLAVDQPPTRLRGMELTDGGIVVKPFNTDEPIRFAVEDLTLIVTGAIFQKRIEATEKQNKKGDNILLKATETASDEKLFDIYTRESENGFRVEQKGFDFSCLGAEKSLLAAENIDRLARKLKSIAPNAELVDNYTQLRGIIGSVWEIAERRDSQGLVRERFGKFNLGNVTTVSNLEQFTKYSRMLNNIL